jgi:hypothetical protein
MCVCVCVCIWRMYVRMQGVGMYECTYVYACVCAHIHVYDVCMCVLRHSSLLYVSQWPMRSSVTRSVTKPHRYSGQSLKTAYVDMYVLLQSPLFIRQPLSLPGATPLRVLAFFKDRLPNLETFKNKMPSCEFRYLKLLPRRCQPSLGLVPVGWEIRALDSTE